ncbi:MAG: hypothetical protein Q8P69_01615 [bacterium]|nr:hypothetical protein [bacterium]
MDIQKISLAVHLVGFALGLGGATASDITFFKALRKRYLSRENLEFLGILSKVIWVGLGLLIVSGLVIFASIYIEQGSLVLLSSPRWQTKLSLVGIVFLNGLFFKFSIFPRLKQLVDSPLTTEKIKKISWRLAFSGTVSILSWYSILVITQLPRTFRPHILYFAGTYLILLVLGILVSKLLISKMINK